MKRIWALRVAAAMAAAVLLCAQMSAELTVRSCRRTGETALPALQPPRTVLSLFIGKLEALVGDVLLLKADNYFHGQTSLLGHTRVGACDAMHGHHERAHEHHACGHDHHDEGGHLHAEHVDHHEHTPGLFYDHFLSRQYAKVAPRAHVHLAQHEEIVPWLYASVRLNPGNERAAVLTAYWLGQQLGRPEVAERVLRAALAERPSSWRLRAELGWLHYRQGRYGPALRQCVSALGLFEPEGAQGPDDEGARIDEAQLWRLASACQEALGDLERAAACAEEVVRLLPNAEASRMRLEVLRSRLEHGGVSDADSPRAE